MDLIVFPEVAHQGCPGWRENSSYPTVQEMAYTQQTAEAVPGPRTSNLVVKAQELNLFVVFGMTEKDAAERLYNAAVFLGPTGVIGTHRKTHLVGNDALIWRPGTQLIEVFDSPLGRMGLLICAELGGEYGSLDSIPGPRLAAAGAVMLVTVFRLVEQYPRSL